MEINAISMIDSRIIIIDREITSCRIYDSREQSAIYLNVACSSRWYHFINESYSLSIEYLSDRYD